MSLFNIELSGDEVANIAADDKEFLQSFFLELTTNPTGIADVLKSPQHGARIRAWLEKQLAVTGK